MAGDSARLGQFPHGVTTTQQHLHDPQTVRVRQGFQKFGGLFQRNQGGQWRLFRR